MRFFPQPHKFIIYQIKFDVNTLIKKNFTFCIEIQNKFDII
uniref:Uncharacterized protein n=1 Tax=Siphoviridae sp. ct8eQ1 TaxID=2826171 RepID=A0A8S5MZU7_9CAUD|nr:MAG TPA: hypothetical protein [Siphoviridae sp. ct8eQ1]